MKKLLTLLALVILLAGCAAAPKKSFLDEKIKCKKLAEEKIDQLEAKWGGRFLILDREFKYNQNLDTCIISYSIHHDEFTTKTIKDLTTNEILADFTDRAFVENYEMNEDYFQRQDEFIEKLKLYFDEDAE